MAPGWRDTRRTRHHRHEDLSADAPSFVQNPLLSEGSQGSVLQFACEAPWRMTLRRYELRFRCHGLLKRDKLSFSDPFVRVYDKKGHEVGCTEIVVNNHDPIFTRPVVVESSWLPLQLVVQDAQPGFKMSEKTSKKDLLGKATLHRPQVESENGVVQLPLEDVDLKVWEKQAGWIIVCAEHYVATRNSIGLKVDVEMAGPVGHLGMALYRKNISGEGWTRVYLSEKLTSEDFHKQASQKVQAVLAIKSLDLGILDKGGFDREVQIVILSGKRGEALSLRSLRARDVYHAHASFITRTDDLLNRRDRCELSEVPGERLRELCVDESDLILREKKVKVGVREAFLIRR